MSHSRVFLYILVPVAFLALGGLSCARPSPDTGVLRSTNSGLDWEQKIKVDDKTTIGKKDVWTIAVSPHDGDRILAGGTEMGVWITTNRGETWAPSNLTAPTIRDIDFSQKTDGIAYAAGIQGGIGKIYKSKDGGSSWSEVFSSTHMEERIDAIAVDWYDDSRIYAGTQDAAVLKSTDDGENWLVQGRFPSRITDIELTMEDSRLLFVGTTSSGIWRTDDGGETWTRLEGNEEEFDNTKKVYDIEVDPALPSIVYVASRYGLTRSKDTGETWEDVPLLVEPGSVSQLRIALDPYSIKPIYVAIDSSFYASDDFGETWDPQKLTGHRIKALEIDPSDPQTLFMGIQQVD